MRVIKYAKHVYDVFCGLGFDHHSRVSFIKQPEGFRMAVVAGERLTKEQREVLFGGINPDLHYQNVGD